MIELVVGENTYMDITEASNIVANEFMDDSDEYLYWDSLSGNDNAKSILIRNFTRFIENKAQFKGVKKRKDDLTFGKLNFPRIIDTVEFECPYEIKVAILAQGLKSAVMNSKDEIKLQNLGVKSYTLDTNNSITFKESNAMYQLENGIYTDIYDTYLRRWTY